MSTGSTISTDDGKTERDVGEHSRNDLYRHKNNYRLNNGKF